MRRRRLDAAVAALIIVPLLGLFAGRLQRLDFQARDRGFHLRGERPPRSEVVVVAIDESALLQVGPWPWPLETIARLVSRIAASKPRVIGLDLESLLPATWAATATSEGLETLRQSLQTAGNVVLPAVLAPPGPARSRPPGAEKWLERFRIGEGVMPQPVTLRGGELITPPPVLLEVAAGLGALNVYPETDNVLRECPLAVAEGKVLYPGFAAELLRTYLGLPPGHQAYRLVGGSLQLGEIAVPLARGAEFPINYAGGYGTYPQVTAAALLGARETGPDADLADKIVIVGLVSSQEAAVLPTPLSPLPGPEIQANAVASLLPGGALRALPWWSGWALALLGGLLMACCLAPAEPRAALLWTAGTVVGYLGVSTVAFWHDLLLPMAVPMVAWAATGVVIVIMAAAAAERARAEAEGQAAARIHTLMNLGELLSAGLERKRLLEDILRWVQRELRVEAASLLLMEEKPPRLRFEAALGGSPEAIMDFTVELGQGIAGTVALTGQPLIVNDARRDPRQARDIAQAVNFPTRDILCVPMIRQNKVVGVIEAINRTDGSPFTEVEADLLSVIAHQAALFLENARLYAELQQRVDFANAELREANQLLASEKARLDALLREMASGVLVTDEAERIILVNSVAEEMLSLRQERVVGQSVFAAVPDQRIAAMFATPLTPRGGSLSEELELPRGSGRMVRAHLTMFDLHGEAIGKCLLLTDVTHFVELDQMKTDLISFVSHELKNPLAAMLAFLHLMRTHPAAQEEPMSRYLAHVQEQAANMQYLVQDYLNVARLEAGRPLEVEWEPISDVQAALEEILSSEGPARDREITVQVAEGVGCLWADRQKLRQILLNLVGNAVKYTPPGTPITVTAEPGEGCVRFAVIDQGPGLSAAAQEHLFEKFRRVRGPGTGRVPGTGIGLYLCKHLVEAHGGQIGVESEPGQGATFWFTLPTQPPVEESRQSRADGEQ